MATRRAGSKTVGFEHEIDGTGQFDCKEPQSNIERVAVEAQASGLININVILSGIASNSIIVATVTDTNNVRLGNPFTNAVTVGTTNVLLSATLPSAQIWSAEFPKLYMLTVQLLDTNFTLIHTVTNLIGFRTIVFSNNVGYFVNGTKVVLRGTCRHEFWPTDGRTTSQVESDLDIGLIKDMNFNAVRMTHYPPNKIFLEECDRLGLYVFDELTGWQHAYDNPIAPELVQEMVIRDVNHPSIIAWDNGNEGGWNTAVDNNGIGMFTWAFLDEGVVCNDLPGKPIDVQNQNAPDGIVGPYREHEASYYTYKTTYNPAQVTPPNLAGFTGTLAVENRFSFTSLYQWNFDWQLGWYPDANDRVDASTNALTGGFLVTMDSGNFAGPNVLPGAPGSLMLPGFPANGTNYDALRLTATDPFGKNLYSWTFPLHSQIRERISGTSCLSSPAISAGTNATAIIVNNGPRIFHFSKPSGVINSLRVRLNNRFLFDVKEMQKDWLTTDLEFGG